MNELSHHGILGMHWGIRRYQNKDGTRIKKNAPNSKQKIDKEINKNTLNSKQKLDKEINKELYNQSKEHFYSLNKKIDEAYKNADEAYKELDSYFKKGLTDKKIRNDYMTKIDKIYKSKGIDAKNDFNFEDIKSNASQQMGSDLFWEKYNKTYSNIDSYYKEIEDITSSVINKFKDTKINNESQSEYIKNFVNKASISGRNLDMHYLNNHFDDYWVNDLESRYNFENSVTIEDYNKWKTTRR